MQRTVTPIFPEAGPSTDYTRPSLFDLLAQDQLRDLFHPVVRYFLSYVAQRYPRYLLRVLNHHEEFFALLLLILERHHLKRHNASVSEHFYGLRTIPSNSLKTPRLDRLYSNSPFPSPNRRDLSRKQRWGLLLFLVGLPYIRARAQDYFDSLGGGRDVDEMNPEDIGIAVTKSQKIFKLVYPYLSLGLDLTFLGYDLAYLFEKTNYPRPWHRWLGLKVIRAGPDDETESSGILSKLPPLLPPLLLLLKLSQWWYSPSSPRSHPSLTANTNTIAATHAAILPPRSLPILPESNLLHKPSLPLTPPLTPEEERDEPPLQPEQSEIPKASSKKEEYKITKDKYGDCPLCGKKWQNPAILPSGWVVCWRCGWDAVEGEDEDENEDNEEKEEDDLDEEQQEQTDIRQKVPEQGVTITRKGRRGRCPITGVAVAPGDLRRVLI
ncbi:uncharacterized protein L201_007616 [Kwoniella dendrophila CBS 6074]|uniref:Peroxisome assembly protein 12 n=1 Tax=Kwoniella dendrophila CBS 6074 TaxID=1295534 RepID=A0AAX4K4V5_9TREE